MKQLFFYLPALFVLTACGEKKPKEHVVIMSDGFEMPTETCEQMFGKMYGKSLEPKQFCACFLTTFYETVKNDPAQLKILKGNAVEYMSKTNQDSLAKVYQRCAVQASTNDTTSKLVLSPSMAASLKRGMLKKMKEEGADESIDADVYCDCVIATLQSDFTAAEFTREDFNQTEKFSKMQEKCAEKAKKK